MRRPRSKLLAWIMKGISVMGILLFLAGVTWFLELRNVWPRAAGDPVPLALIEALAFIVGGLVIAAWARQGPG